MKLAVTQIELFKNMVHLLQTMWGFAILTTYLLTFFSAFIEYATSDAWLKKFCIQAIRFIAFKFIVLCVIIETWTGKFWLKRWFNRSQFDRAVWFWKAFCDKLHNSLWMQWNGKHFVLFVIVLRWKCRTIISEDLNRMSKCNVYYV